MKTNLLILTFVLLSFLAYSQNSGSSNLKRASIYVPIIKLMSEDLSYQMLEGNWSGEVLWNQNKKNILVANGYGKWEYFKNNKLMFSLTGTANMGEFNGDLILYIYSNIGVEKYEGYVTKGIPDGKIKFTTPEGIILQGNFPKGVLNGDLKVFYPGKGNYSMRCDYLSFKELLLNPNTISKCKAYQE